MLFCDGCDLATYHMACLLPPIEVVPDDDWYCPVCEQVGKKMEPTLLCSKYLVSLQVANAYQAISVIERLNIDISGTVVSALEA